MKNSIRHKWKHDQYASICINCDLRKRTISENILQPNGTVKKVFRIEYFSNDGVIVKNLGCVKNKQLKLFFK